ncbi:MFS transporter [Lujinxingia litoralis]|uniref:MFS transporter n=1 Tax=Lujinxingia litoralis TaxID=2211119 RepID=A0A328C2G8_9DELT|nr:MFS transporter [Lujinxingia litoralis]RAL20115.1 MFS transporter [Lujinxingia litoralis]
MQAAIRHSWALFVGIALIMLGNGLQTSLLGLRATLEGFDTTATGVIMSAFYVGFLAGSKLTPGIVKNVGHIRVFAAWSSMASAAILLHGLIVEPWFWVVMRALTGFCYAGVYVVAESWLNDRADNRTRGQLLAVYMVVQYVGLSGGQLLLNVGPPSEMVLFVLTSVLISLALVPISLTTSAPQPSEAQEALRLRELFKISPLGVLTCGGAGLSAGALLGMGAVFAEEVGLSVGEVSIYMAVLIAGAALLEFPIGRLSDRFERRVLIVVTSVLTVLTALGGWAAMGASSAVVLTMAFLLGGFSLPVYALGVAHTNDVLRPGQRVAASSALVMVFGLGASLGPVGVALVMGAMGPGGFYVGVAGVHVAIGVFGLYRFASHEGPDVQLPYRPIGVGRPFWRRRP